LILGGEINPTFGKLAPYSIFSREILFSFFGEPVGFFGVLHFENAGLASGTRI
jgi:hypothetical protein